MIITALAILAVAVAPSLAQRLADYDVVWDSPSVDAAGSMPIGNGEVVLNVWCEEATGDILFYIARTDALSEISRILKLGRVRVHFSPSPFLNAKDFSQRLRLHDGVIDFTTQIAKLQLVVDSETDAVYVSGKTSAPTHVTATIECWRNEPRKIPKDEQRSAWSVHDAPFDLIESADVFPESGAGEVVWYHRNETSVVPKLWENQSLTGLKGTFDPLLHRTFGGRLQGDGFVKSGNRSIQSMGAVNQFSINVTTLCKVTNTTEDWLGLLAAHPAAPAKDALKRTQEWWHKFWDRSWVFVEGATGGEPVPKNPLPLRKAIDSNGSNVFPGDISRWEAFEFPMIPPKVQDRESPIPGHEVGPNPSFKVGFTLSAWIRPTTLTPGRIFDKMTAGGNDGFIFDTHPGDRLRLIVGDMTLSSPSCLVKDKWQYVAASYDSKTGEANLYLDGKRVAHREAEDGKMITRGYLLQRYCQAIQGRGEYPIKFNGGYFTVEPTAMGLPYNPDYRNWGDSHWFQNLPHMVHPMLEQGDFEMMEPFFRLYENARPLAESRTEKYHHAKGAYFPETMTVFGTYSGGDYGWDRTGHEPKDVLCPWWQYAWNQGPELVALMLDRWDYTRDGSFLKHRVLPMAESVLQYFDTRFKKDANGKIILDPTQVVETYWQGVINDMPSTAGLIAITDRLTKLPEQLTTKEQRDFFEQMKRACPDLPLQTANGQQELAPAQKYKNETSNVENGELYAVWPFQVVSLGKSQLLEEAKRAYAHRKNRLDVGWGYDGNVAALLGLTEEAGRILKVKCANSHHAYRWPATWGPNFDWLPDQNHGGNLLNTTNLMLLQGEPLESGGAIRLLPAWPKAWDVSFKLHAPGNTTVECEAKGGTILRLVVTPKSRMKDVVYPEGWQRK